MDIFSAGCVIAELFLDGEPLFDLGRLLGYRRGDSAAISYVRDALLRISDPAIRGMVSSMISVDPMQRLSARDYLVRCSSEEKPRLGAKRCTSVSDMDDSDMAAAAAAVTLAKSAVASPMGGISFSPQDRDDMDNGRPIGARDLNIVPVNVFPWHFSGFMFGFIQKLVGDPAFLSADMKVLAICKRYGDIVRLVAGIPQGDPDGEAFFAAHLDLLRGRERGRHDSNSTARTGLDSITEMDKFKSETKQQSSRLNPESGDSVSALDSLMVSLKKTLANVIRHKDVESLSDSHHKHKAHSGALPNVTGLERLHLDKNLKARSTHSSPMVEQICEQNGLCIILELLCSCVQAVQGPECRITALHLIVRFSRFCDDADNVNVHHDGRRHAFRSSRVRLHRLLPHIVLCLRDSSARVRAQAVLALTALVEGVNAFLPTDANLFPDYIFPALLRFTAEPDITARLTFVECIGRLALTSERFLDRAQALKQAKASDERKSVSVENIENGLNEVRQVSKLAMQRPTAREAFTVGTRAGSTNLPDVEAHISAVEAPYMKAPNEMTTNLRETQDMAHNAGVASDDPVVDQANDAKTTRRGNISSESSVFVPGSYDFEQSRLRDLVSKIIASLVGNSRPRARDSSPPPFGSDARVRYDANVHMDREMRSIVKQTLLKSIALLTCFFWKREKQRIPFSDDDIVFE
jgi:phosphoinositide-3-kinase regulatory subunit 4